MGQDVRTSVRSPRENALFPAISDRSSTTVHFFARYPSSPSDTARTMSLRRVVLPCCGAEMMRVFKIFPSWRIWDASFFCTPIFFPGKADIHGRKAADQPDAAAFAHCFSATPMRIPPLHCKKPCRSSSEKECRNAGKGQAGYRRFPVYRAASAGYALLPLHKTSLSFRHAAEALLPWESSSPLPIFSQRRGKVSENFFCHPSMLLYLLFIHVYGCLTDVIPINFPPYICFCT